VNAGLLALHWLTQGYGYDVTSADVWAAYASTMQAAEQAGRASEVKGRIRRLVELETFGERFVTKILRRELAL
jgi:hypothetical protein